MLHIFLFLNHERRISVGKISLVFAKSSFIHGEKHVWKGTLLFDSKNSSTEQEISSNTQAMVGMAIKCGNMNENHFMTTLFLNIFKL